MQVHDVIDIEIDRMSFGPAAVGRHRAPGEDRAMVVFVRGAMPGEHVRVRLTKSHKNYWEGELVEILRPSPERVSPPCPVFGVCGGCQWQYMSYPAQLQAKTEILLHQLHRSTRIKVAELQSKLTLHGAKNPYGYRARLQAHGDEHGIGFFKSGTHEIAHVERCQVASAAIQKAWSELSASSRKHELAQATGQFKVEWLDTGTGKIKEAINRKHGAFGFTQINPEQNEALVQTVSKLSKGAARARLLVDLYGGNGNLSLNLTKEYEHVLCVDTYNDGKDPTELQRPLSPGHHLIRSSVEDFLVNQYWRDWDFEQIDCVIADPPRTGLKDTADRIAELRAARVVLVSCDPSTLSRDLSAFKDYEVEEIHLIDMFPQTYHLETVVSLRAKA